MIIINDVNREDDSEIGLNLGRKIEHRNESQPLILLLMVEG